MIKAIASLAKLISSGVFAASSKSWGDANAEVFKTKSMDSRTRSERADLTGQVPVLGFVRVGFSEVGFSISKIFFLESAESTTDSTKL